MTGAEAPGAGGTALRNSLWNILYRIVSSTDHSRTAWSSILRGACLEFFSEPIDELPLGDNDASRQALRERYFGLPDHRVYDLFEFLLTDDRAGVKEMDRKLIRRTMNEVLEREGAPVRLLRDRFVPLPDSLGFDAVATAEEQLTLFDMAAASRHLDSSVAFLARRPRPDGRAAVREAVLALAAVVRTLGGAQGGIVLGTVGPLAERSGIPRDLLEGVEATLRRCHAVSGLPGGTRGEGELDESEAAFLVVFCASVIRYLLSRQGQGNALEGRGQS